jgi:hypothetical protein
MKKYILSLILFSFFLTSKGQNHTDALRYSFLESLGTARYSALSGSFNSLGGDMSVIQSNPASLAIYRTDELSISFASSNKNTKSNLLGIKNQYDEQKIYLQNLGLVKTLNLGEENLNGWNRFSWAFTFNRLQNFNQKINFSGETTTSRINNFLDAAQGVHPDDLNPFSESLAYYGWLIDTMPHPQTQRVTLCLRKGVRTYADNQW